LNPSAPSFCTGAKRVREAPLTRLRIEILLELGGRNRTRRTWKNPIEGLWREKVTASPTMQQPGGGGFQHLLQQAAALKGEQVKAERRKFEAQPTFLQNTLFHCRHEDVMKVREMTDVEERISAATEFKTKGNELFQKGDLLAANDMYERCIGCFWFIETSEPNFKDKGIKDEYLTFHKEHTDNERVRKLIASALVNGAGCHQQFKQWLQSVQNCTYAIELDDTNAKAFYRRAQARTIPVSCGALDLDYAIQDLRQAVKLKPDDRSLRKMYNDLVAQRTRQRQADKTTFSGIFEKADLAEDAVEDKENMTASQNSSSHIQDNPSQKHNQRSTEQEISMYKDIAASLRQAGRDEDAAQVEKAVAQAEESLERKRLLGSNDFRNPTPQMIREAKEEHGIDLTDPQVQDELRRQWERREKGLEPDFGDLGGTSESGEGGIKSPINGNLMLLIVFVAIIASIISSASSEWPPTAPWFSTSS